MEKPHLLGWKIGLGKDLKDHRKLRMVRNHETIFVIDKNVNAIYPNTENNKG